MRLPTLVFLAVSLISGCVDLGQGTSGSSSSSSGGTTTLPDGGTTTASTLRALDVIGFCARLTNECGSGIDQATCVRTYTPVRVTTGCATAVTTATCADLLSVSSTVSQTCFPTCTSSTLATCNGNGTITVCTEIGVQNVDDCSATCTAQGYSAWTGICASTYNGQVSDRDQCWCQ